MEDREINDLFGKALNKRILDLGRQKKDVFFDSGVATNTFYGCLTGNKGTQLDKLDRILRAVGIDVLSVFDPKGMASADASDFISFALAGGVQAGYSNGHIDVDVHEGDLENWEGPTVSVARDFLKKGLRGESVRDILALTIHGDSMTPIFQEGDHVFIKRSNDMGRVQHKDIIVMDTDGCGSYTIKMWDKAGVLVPLNPKHDVITISQCPGCRLYGRVIGLERTF